jgi:hypothetical protein
MTKTELSLLLYLETRAVDYGGRVAQEKMNDEDRNIITKWVKEGFIEFGRIALKYVNIEGSAWVRLSEKAWNLAHIERINRATRMWEKRTWRKTSEK